MNNCVKARYVVKIYIITRNNQRKMFFFNITNKQE